ncbi:unnamed protein product [Anisakis simplex]|uniref:Integrin beta n=1 Tax=Anisakis simplex TaxID=6269 RepID=A0A0M3IZQ1_ANISI|nr:unnamed protein product [Anisakis simplex]
MILLEYQISRGFEAEVLHRRVGNAMVYGSNEKFVFLLVLSSVITTSLLNAQEYHDDPVTATVLESKQDFPCYSLPKENYTCSACIQFHDTCAWCSKVGFDDDNQHPRCDSLERLAEHGCPDDEIEFPKTTVQTAENQPLTNAGDIASEEEAIQLKPQRMVVNIRPKARVRFNVTYRQAVDYPVDLYYLMDLSYSMKDDKKKLSELGDLLAERMRAITKNFRLGFGSFIDKKLMPFVDPRPEK